MSKLKDPIVKCRECKKGFQLSDDYLVPEINFKVWKCPHCDWANTKPDLNLV